MYTSCAVSETWKRRLPPSSSRWKCLLEGTTVSQTANVFSLNDGLSSAMLRCAVIALIVKAVGISETSVSF
jgi:hypothetical protein